MFYLNAFFFSNFELNDFKYKCLHYKSKPNTTMFTSIQWMYTAGYDEEGQYVPHGPEETDEESEEEEEEEDESECTMSVPKTVIFWNYILHSTYIWVETWFLLTFF